MVSPAVSSDLTDRTCKCRAGTHFVCRLMAIADQNQETLTIN